MNRWPLLTLAAFTTSFASFAIAADDPAWAHLEDLQHQLQADAPKGVNEVEFYAPVEIELHDAALAYAAAHPGDPRRWDADLLALKTQQFPAPAADRRVIFARNEALLAQILGASDASVKTKQMAERKVLTQHLDHLDLLENAREAGELEVRLADYLKRFPDEPKAANLEVRRVDLWQRVDPSRASALLGELASNSDPKIAEAARGRLDQRNLFNTPLDWKLTGVDGQLIDLSAWHGKVVLVQFWASWCPDCMREMPAVLAAYHRLHDQGLEIVGVSLDKDRDAMLATVKKKGIPWPQLYDGKGWDADLAVRYGVKGIPEMWLLDATGRVVRTGIQADELEALVTRSLAVR